MIEQLGRDTRKARKVHRCFHCLTTIKKGEIYTDSRFASDGMAYTLRTHKLCDEMAETVGLYNNAGEEGVTAGELRDNLHEGDCWEQHLKDLSSVNGSKSDE